MSGENSGSFPEWDIKLPEIEGSVLSTKVRMRSTRVFFYKVSTIQKCQYCQLCFSYVIQNKQDQ